MARRSVGVVQAGRPVQLRGVRPSRSLAAGLVGNASRGTSRGLIRVICRWRLKDPAYKLPQLLGISPPRRPNDAWLPIVFILDGDLVRERVGAHGGHSTGVRLIRVSLNSLEHRPDLRGFIRLQCFQIKLVGAGDAGYSSGAPDSDSH